MRLFRQVLMSCLQAHALHLLQLTRMVKLERKITPIIGAA